MLIIERQFSAPRACYTWLKWEQTLSPMKDRCQTETSLTTGNTLARFFVLFLLVLASGLGQLMGPVVFIACLPAR